MQIMRWSLFRLVLVMRSLNSIMTERIKFHATPSLSIAHVASPKYATHCNRFNGLLETSIQVTIQALLAGISQTLCQFHLHKQTASSGYRSRKRTAQRFFIFHPLSKAADAGSSLFRWQVKIQLYDIQLELQRRTTWASDVTGTHSQNSIVFLCKLVYFT